MVLSGIISERLSCSARRRDSDRARWCYKTESLEPEEIRHREWHEVGGSGGYFPTGFRKLRKRGTPKEGHWKYALSGGYGG
ncbi:hypothetical protein Bca4012_059005 [Brassica carinata]